ncbi:MAG: sigma-70 family RNA polymerase sigma factor, partial [Phycisphaerae bacterium]|nr:sigma-70 family RNA polymerase sigma factor [Phycisphaerae bacterium]
QEVWLKLVTALVEFRYDPARGQFRTWLYTVVRSAAANAHRRRKKQAAKDLSEDSPDVSTDAGGDPAAAMETSDTQRVTSAIVRSTLEKLRSEVSPANYQVLQLRFIDGLPVATVAERLGITPEQVWFRQCRGKKQLARLFSQRDCGEFDL